MSDDLRTRLVLSALDARRDGDPILVLAIGPATITITWKGSDDD